MPLFDPYGDYQTALSNYQQLADIYNLAGENYNSSVNAWNDYVYGRGPQVERPSESFNMEAPIAPIAPPEQEVNPYSADINPVELYQKQFGRSTPDVLSNEAWSLSNLTSPFLSSESGGIYETGGISQMNNPLSYMGPDALTTGQVSQPYGSQIGTENKYY